MTATAAADGTDTVLVCSAFTEEELAELELEQQVRYRPDSLDSLCAQTNFSRKELQLLYRGFKQGSPTGVVSRKRFVEIYNQFFIQGDSSTYANFVFDTFDKDGNGQITFSEFASALSVLSKGSVDEKLEWIFTLYDVKKRGYLTKKDFYIVLRSIYDMMGKHTDPPISGEVINEHVDDIFSRMDENGDGCIEKEEFLSCCRQNNYVCEALELFNTVMEAPS